MFLHTYIGEVCLYKNITFFSFIVWMCMCLWIRFISDIHIAPNKANCKWKKCFRMLEILSWCHCKLFVEVDEIYVFFLRIWILIMLTWRLEVLALSHFWSMLACLMTRYIKMFEFWLTLFSFLYKSKIIFSEQSMKSL